MRKFNFLCMLFLCFFYVQGETLFYRNYFRQINIAEFQISNSNYKEADRIYRKIYKTYPHLFYKDIHNACICAIKLGKYNKAYYWSKLLILHGYELKDFECLIFEKFKNDKIWKLFLLEYPKLRMKYESTLNKEIRDKYLFLYSQDQLAANHNKDIKLQDSLFRNLSNKLSKIIIENGFPRYMLNKDTINIRLFTMLRHYCGFENRISSKRGQKDSIKINITPIFSLMKKALNDGLVLPETYINVVSYWDTAKYGEMYIYVDFEKEKVFTSLRIPKEEIDKINKLRDSIGLYPINKQTNNLLYYTWFSKYPFKNIKKAILNCDSCFKYSDIAKICIKFEMDVYNEYVNKNNNYFLIPDLNDSKNIYYLNLKNTHSNDINHKRK